MSKQRIPSRGECIRLIQEIGCSARVLAHCKMVHRLAMKIAPLCGADIKKVSAGALLHDIGRSKTHGIMHAVEGAKIARRLRLHGDLVKIIERHIGAGIPREEAKKLGLPLRHYIPMSIEEKVVAHADNLIASYSKQPLAKLTGKWRREGLHKGAARIEALHWELSSRCGMDLDKIKL